MTNANLPAIGARSAVIPYSAVPLSGIAEFHAGATAMLPCDSLFFAHGISCNPLKGLLRS